MCLHVTPFVRPANPTPLALRLVNEIMKLPRFV